MLLMLKACSHYQASCVVASAGQQQLAEAPLHLDLVGCQLLLMLNA
jgi:hypothetical protein